MIKRGNFVVLCVYVVALVILLFFIIPIVKGYRSTSWPTADAEILDTRIKTSRGYRGSTTHYAAIDYSYTVGNTKYRGDTVTFAIFRMDPGLDAKELVKKFRKGTITKVAYNKDSPEESVLVPGYSLYDIGMVVLVFSGITLVVIKRFKMNQ